MTIKKADVVISLNGRDKGKRFMVVETEDEYVMIADGKGRRIEKPKRKKNKHLEFENKLDGQIADKLTGGEKVTNNEVRRTLAQYFAEREESCTQADKAETVCKAWK